MLYLQQLPGQFDFGTIYIHQIFVICVQLLLNVFFLFLRHGHVHGGIRSPTVLIQRASFIGSKHKTKIITIRISVKKTLTYLIWPTFPQAPHFNFKSGLSLVFLRDLDGEAFELLFNDDVAGVDGPNQKVLSVKTKQTFLGKFINLQNDNKK